MPASSVLGSTLMTALWDLNVHCMNPGHMLQRAWHLRIRRGTWYVCVALRALRVAYITYPTTHHWCWKCLAGIETGAQLGRRGGGFEPGCAAGYQSAYVLGDGGRLTDAHKKRALRLH
jgi:hypothetical protein